MSSRKRISWIEGLGLRAQLVAFFLVVFGCLFAAFSAGMYLYIASVHRHEFDAALYNYVVDVSHTMPELSSSETRVWDPAEVETELLLPFSRSHVLLQVSDPEGHVLLQSKNLGVHRLPTLTLPTVSLTADTADTALYTDARLRRTSQRTDRDRRYRMVTHGFSRDGKHYYVQAAVPMVLLEHQQESLLLFLAIAVPLMLVFAGWAGLAFSRRAMAPVAAIIQKANEIEVRKLSDRIPVPACRDEVRELATTLNGLLDRLELAFRSQEAFVADASHQLKTPLSILKGEVELFRKRGQARPEEMEELLASVAQEVGSLERMVQDLLLLAQADSRQIEQWSQRFDLGERVLESVARFARVQKSVRLAVNLHPDDEASPSFDLMGDPELARALVENLVDNAMKYSPAGTTVFVDLRADRKNLILDVRDEGPGIPPESLPMVFDRFYRASHTQNTATGSGLGLAIVRRVANLHGGEVTVENSKPHGAVFTVRLPRA